MLTSPQNPRLKQVIALREKRERERLNLMNVEGFEELGFALASGLIPSTLFYCPALFANPAQKKRLLEFRRGGTELIEVDRRVFEKIAYRENPDGWLALCPLPQRPLTDLPLGAIPFVLIVERVEKPGNLGAMLRTAEAAGVQAVIACDPITDWGNPNVVRASKGAVFSVPVAQADSATVIAWLREKGIQIVAAITQAQRPYTAADLRGAVAVVVGEEKHGLSPQWMDQADVAVQIPMFGQINSLNVAASAAILLYEVVRQRGAK